MNDDSFFSFEGLLEFGLGMAAADQMVNVMKQSLQPNASGVNNNLAQQSAPLYYVAINGQQAGPFSESELSRMVSEKKVTASTYVWKPGMSGWKLASEVPEVLRIVALAPPPFNK